MPRKETPRRKEPEASRPTRRVAGEEEDMTC
jgi:hypothetical protein